MVSVVEDAAAKENAKPPGPTGDSTGLELETTLSVRAWVRNVDPVKHSWVDLHVFDEHDQLIRAETQALEWLKGAGDDGDIYGFDGSVFRGTGAVGGSVWFGSDARKLQYRLYYEVNGTVFSDGILRQYEVPPDAQVVNPAPARRRKAATAAANGKAPAKTAAKPRAKSASAKPRAGGGTRG